MRSAAASDSPPPTADTGFDVERFGCLGHGPTGLPIVTKATALAAGLATIGQLSRLVGRSPETVKRWITDGDAPGPVAVLQHTSGPGRQPHLYPRQRFLDAPYGDRVRSRPPVKVGLRTSRASRSYRWRDPARWKAENGDAS